MPLACEPVRRSLDAEVTYEDEWAAREGAEDERVIYGTVRASGQSGGTS
jgi:hypothetical protein